jgi:hypothetical protein
MARESFGRYRGGFMLTGIAIYGYFWLLPEVEKEIERLQATKKLKPEDERRSVSLAQIIAREGHRKQQRNGTTEKGTMVDKSQEDLMEVCLDFLKETTAGLEEARADLKESRAAIDRIAKLAPQSRRKGVAEWDQKLLHIECICSYVCSFF